MRAVLYVPNQPQNARWCSECGDLCARMRWRIGAVTGDPQTARALVTQGGADLVVVARPRHARQVQLVVVAVTDPPRRLAGRDRPRRLR